MPNTIDRLTLTREEIPRPKNATELEWPEDHLKYEMYFKEAPAVRTMKIISRVKLMATKYPKDFMQAIEFQASMDLFELLRKRSVEE